MQYALMIYAEPTAQDGQTDDERAAVTAEYVAINDDPRVVTSGGLEPVETATTVRQANGNPMVTDGPFAETKEVFNGFFIVEADDIDGALELAQRMPAVRLGGAIEIRPLRFLAR